MPIDDDLRLRWGSLDKQVNSSMWWYNTGYNFSMLLCCIIDIDYVEECINLRPIVVVFEKMCDMKKGLCIVHEYKV